MVSTIDKPKLKLSRDEVLFLARVSERIGWYGEEVLCPRCGKRLMLEEVGNSYSAACTGNECIRVDFRGL